MTAELAEIESRMYAAPLRERVPKWANFRNAVYLAIILGSGVGGYILGDHLADAREPRSNGVAVADSDQQPDNAAESHERGVTGLPGVFAAVGVELAVGAVCTIDRVLDKRTFVATPPEAEACV